MSVSCRLNRLFGSDGKCCEVAIDHGVHNEVSFLQGIEDLANVIEVMVASGADALLLSMGQAALLQDRMGRQKPSLVLRSDPTNFYGNPTPSNVFCELLHDAVERAVALDAVSVVVNLIWAQDQSDLHRQCISNISKLKPQCERYGLPKIV
jgi:class I fructose-bisphosphate aldolase